MQDRMACGGTRVHSDGQEGHVPPAESVSWMGLFLGAIKKLHFGLDRIASVV